MGSTKPVISPPHKNPTGNINNNLKLSRSYYVERLHLSEINLPEA